MSNPQNLSLQKLVSKLGSGSKKLKNPQAPNHMPTNPVKPEPPSTASIYGVSPDDVKQMDTLNSSNSNIPKLMSHAGHQSVDSAPTLPHYNVQIPAQNDNIKATHFTARPPGNNISPRFNLQNSTNLNLNFLPAQVVSQT